MKKIPVTFLALFGALSLVTTCNDPFATTPDEETCWQTRIHSIDVVPDTARMGIDTVYVTVRYEPSAKYNLQFFWIGRIIAEDRDKTNLTTVRCFIPNDTTESLPVDIKAVSGSVVIEDPENKDRCSFVLGSFTIYLKRVGK
jgi:hypothetical protein